jgi:hypothetical protein
LTRGSWATSNRSGWRSSAPCTGLRCGDRRRDPAGALGVAVTDMTGRILRGSRAPAPQSTGDPEPADR